MTTVVFVGPSLSADEVGRLAPGACVLPPAARGDVYRAVRDGADCVALIDGYFDSVPAVWHKELLWALAQGASVFGASSIGALRAAEMARFGMVGVGAVYEAFAAGELTDDDEVAVVHAPADHEFRAMSVAMVNIRATLAAARAAEIIDDAAHALLVSAAKRLHYRDRDYRTLLAAPAVVAALGEELPVRLVDWLHSHAVDQKACDARELLHRMDEIADVGVEGRRFKPTVYWERLVDSVPIGRMSAGIDEILVELGLRGGPSVQQLMTSALSRVLALRDASRWGGDWREAREQTRARIYERDGLYDAGRRARWMAANAIQSQGELDRLIDEEAQIRLISVVATDDTRRAAIEHLKVTGLLAGVLARLADKRNVLSRVPLSAVSEEDLAEWYFAARRQPIPPDLERYAQGCGFDGVYDFLVAVRHEYTYASARVPEGPGDRREEAR